MHTFSNRQIGFIVGVSLLTTAVILAFGLWQIGRDLLHEASATPAPVVGEPPLQVSTLQPASATPSPTASPTATLSPSATATIGITASPTTEPTALPSTDAPTDTPTETPLPPTPAPTEIAAAATDAVAEDVVAEDTPDDECTPPEGWVGHTVEAGETLFAFQLGSGNSASVDDILAGNCLTDRWIYEGQFLFLPPGAAENAPPSYAPPTAYVDPNAPPPPVGLTRTPNCPCTITIRTGWRLEQIAETIDSLPAGFYGRDFMAVAGKGSSYPPRDILAGAPPGASLEGYMLPGTYTITNEMDARLFRDMLLDAFAANVTFLGDAAAQGLTPYDAVNLASIIVKESGNAENQRWISSVFHNRLRAGKGLAASVTTMYALGRPGNWWPSPHGYVSTLDSPYNTNLYRGLPPSPIASPGLSALQAAVYPPASNYWYFSANCRGPGIFFAETYEQHLANVRCE